MLSARFLLHYFLICLISSCRAQGNSSSNNINNNNTISLDDGADNQVDTCGLRSEIPKKDTGKLVHLMNEEHNGLMGARGYLIYPIENAYSEDQVRYLPLKFHSFATNSRSSLEELKLIGDCTNLTIRLDSSGRTHGNQKVYLFDELELSGPVIGSCKVRRPNLVNFSEDNYYSCRSRRVFACESKPISRSISRNTRADEEIRTWPSVVVVLQDFEFEINGKHNEIFKGKFSKSSRRNCDDSRGDYSWTTMEITTPHYY